MDLTNAAGQGHVAALSITAKYTSTITIQSAALYVDRLFMSGGTIDGPKNLIITQLTSLPGLVATNFGTSYFIAGTIKPSSFRLYGENAHKATLQLAINSDGTVTGNPDLETDYSDTADATLLWTPVNKVNAGNVTVGGGKTIDLEGTFRADNPGGTMGNNTAVWTIKSNPDSTLDQGKGKLNNVDVKPIGGGGRILKTPSMVQDGTPDIFYVIGDIADDGNGSYVEVQSGTLEVDGYITQNSGTTIVDPGQTLAVTTNNGGSGSFAVTGGTVTDGGTGSTITAVSFQQSGGTTTLNGGSTLTAPTTTLSGGSLTISSATLSASSGLSIQSAGTLYGRGGTITGNVTNAGILDLIIGTSVGTLTVQGNYTQTGTMNANLGGTNYSNGYLIVTGTANLGGTLNVTLLGGFMPQPGNNFLIVAAGTLTGGWAVNLPGLTHGQWEVLYNTPPGTFYLDVTM